MKKFTSIIIIILLMPFNALAYSERLPKIDWPESTPVPTRCAIVRLQDKRKPLLGWAWGVGTGWSVYTRYSEWEELEITSSDPLDFDARGNIYVGRLRVPGSGEYKVDCRQLYPVNCSVTLTQQNRQII